MLLLENQNYLLISFKGSQFKKNYFQSINGLLWSPSLKTAGTLFKDEDSGTLTPAPLYQDHHLVVGPEGRVQQLRWEVVG